MRSDVGEWGRQLNHRGTEDTEEHRDALVGSDGTLCVPAGENPSRTERERSDSVDLPSGPRAAARSRQAWDGARGSCSMISKFLIIRRQLGELRWTTSRPESHGRKTGAGERGRTPETLASRAEGPAAEARTAGVRVPDLNANGTSLCVPLCSLSLCVEML